MAINGMNSYGRANGFLNTRYLPDPQREYSIVYDRLDGGLNLYEMEYRLNANESPDMKNLLWVDGALGCRDGQTWLSDDDELGVGYCCYEDEFWDNMFCHIGTKLYYTDPGAETPALTELYDGVPEHRGVFFRYKDHLFYKTRGAYIQISYSTTAPHFTATDVEAYVPVIVMNASPTNGSGDMYQPENRLSPQKTVWYNATAMVRNQTFTGDGTTTEFALDYNSGSQARLVKVDYVYTGNTSVSTGLFTVDLAAGTVTFTTAPSSGTIVTIIYSTAVYEYLLPVVPDSVDTVIVDGTTLTADTDYTVDLTTGKITFTLGPNVTNPATNNTVKVTYTKANTDAYNSVMDCQLAAVCGGDQGVCVVMAGCQAQPNAYFWNGNHSVMDAGYFPISQYNLAGDVEEGITGFGLQQSSLVIFKQHSVGRATYGTTEVDDRLMIELPFTPINARIGCDLPWTIQLIENNLVWCNTEAGVHYLSSSTSAFENNVICISNKVNGTEYQIGELATTKYGLLHDVRSVLPRTVCSLDDGTRYWVVANGHAYVWDYQLSNQKEPSWFYFTNINAVSFCMDDERTLRHLNALGQLTEMVRTYKDYTDDASGAIEKVYQFPAQNFGNYDAYKTVTSVLFVVRSDTDTLIDITYRTDYEERKDLTPIVSYCWRLVPRNLLWRFLGIPRFATVARRRAGCRNIRHFAMRLTNNTVGNDLSVISAQIFYKLQGRQR